MNLQKFLQTSVPASIILALVALTAPVLGQQSEKSPKTVQQSDSLSVITDSRPVMISADKPIVLLPLYLLDDRVISPKEAIRLSPSTIDQVVVWKGADAKKRYGDAAAAGAVVITSKAKTGQKEIATQDETENMRDKIRKTLPMLMVDGKEVSSIDHILPGDIESILVLKDKSAYDQYGEKGKNGVVLIRTKEKTE